MLSVEQQHLTLLGRLEESVTPIDEDNITTSEEIEIMYQAIAGAVQSPLPTGHPAYA